MGAIDNAISELENRLATLQASKASIEAEIADVKDRIVGLRNKAAGETLKAEFANASQDKAQYVSGNTFPIDELPDSFAIVTKSNPIEDKHRLFVSLFAGRPDVHAIRYQSRNGSGYTPHCLNRFKPPCPRQRDKKRKCSDCENQSFPGITIDLLRAHLGGESDACKDVLGAYPLDVDDLCTFIIADFDDKHNGEGDKDDEAKTNFEAMRTTAVGFYESCLERGIPAHLEISRSGHGLHVWLFFSEPVPAYQARRLFSWALTQAMDHSPGFDMSTYDRFIPSQDILAKGGFGNLVALPLQGKAGRMRRSVFVDKDLRQHSDQWEYLSRAKKLSAIELDSILSNISLGVELGRLVPNEKEDQLGKPWEKRKPEVPLSRTDFSGLVTITSANMIHIEKRCLSPRALNRIRRLAAFKNPQFFEHQRMRISTWNIPRVISTADETSEYISIPRGAYGELLGLLDLAGANYNIDDLREPGKPLDVEFTQTLRDGQVPAAEALLAHDSGVLHATTAFGKTVIGNYLIAQRKVNTLVLVGTQQLLNQWKDALAFFLDIKNEPATRETSTGRVKTIGTVGEYGGNKKHSTFIVDVAMMQSLCRKGEVRDFVKDYGMVIVDECHHVPASTFEAVLKHANAKYVYGLTATPMREDGHHAILFLECGPIRYKVDAREQAEQRPFDHYMIPRFTNLRQTSLHSDKQVPIILNDIMLDERRNQLLLGDITTAIHEGRQPLVLTERTEHVRMLADALSASCDNVVALTGGMSNKLKRSVNERLAALRDDEPFVLVATGKYIGEGFDFPRLDTLFITMPIAARSKVTQYIGRLHRLYDGKKDVLVYDYVDISVPVLERMYHKRIKGYKAAGYQVLSGSERVEAPGFIFDAAGYWDVFAADCGNAKKHIVVSSPSLTAKKVTGLLHSISPTALTNSIITIITKPSDAYSDRMKQVIANQMKRLQEHGIKVDECNDLHKSFAVLDQNLVWYGSIHPLGYCSDGASIIRIEDDSLAAALLESRPHTPFLTPPGCLD
jgi:superfamily II DNA or RNA helicase